MQKELSVVRKEEEKKKKSRLRSTEIALTTPRADHGVLMVRSKKISTYCIVTVNKKRQKKKKSHSKYLVI